MQALASRTRLEVGPVCVELIAQPLQEQHAEDVFLVLRGIHVAPQDVARFEEQALQAGKGELSGIGVGGCLNLNFS